MSELLVKFGVLSVQDFIGQSRRLRDLAAGSAVLTYLMKRTIDDVIRIPHIEPVLPRADGESFSNLLTFKCVASAKEELADIMTDLCRNFRTNWRNIAAASVGPIASQKKLDAQFDGVFWPVWAAVPYAPSDPFEATFQNLQQSFEQRKQIRTFAQIDQFEPPSNANERCLVCARREALITDRQRPGLLKKNERLCAVCYAKRLKFRKVADTAEIFPAIARFSSTHELASHVALTAMENEPGFTKFESDYMARRNDVSGLPEDLRDALVEPDYDDILENFLKKESEPLSQFVREIVARRRRLREESDSYYAIVQLDGDEMGRWLGGAFGRPPGQALADLQSGLAKRLSDFADTQHEIARALDGELIYAGGDDSLIFAPRERALTILDRLKTKFDDIFGDIVVCGRSPTVSAALLFVHQNYPLRDALRLARETLENWAKEGGRGGRNAFAVKVVMGTGAETTYVAKWDDSTAADALIVGESKKKSSMPLVVASTAFAEASVSKSFFYDLIGELPALLGDGEAGASEIDRQMLSAEALRLLSRRVPADVPGGRALIERLHRALLAGAEPPNGSMNRLTHFDALLRILAFLARTEAAA